MADSREHPYIPTLKRQLTERTLDRREFLRTATLLGMSAGAAYAFAGKVTGERLLPAAEAQTLPKGGTLRLGMRCQDLKSPHTYSWIESANAARQVCDYLAVTGVDNVTRPGARLQMGGIGGPQDLDLHHPPTFNWHDGRPFTAEDVVVEHQALPR